MLDASSVEALEMSFLEQEIFKALSEAEGDKAPRLVNFLFKFAQSFQSLFKDDLVSMF